MGSLMSMNKEAHSARGELLAAQKGLVGRHGSDEISVVGLRACGEHCCQQSKSICPFARSSRMWVDGAVSRAAARSSPV